VSVDADAQAVAVLAEAFADYPALRCIIGPLGVSRCRPPRAGRPN